jgi:S-layer homology domain
LVEASGRDFTIHVMAADAAGNISRLEIVVQAAPRYGDVPMGHPAFTAIEHLSDQGIVEGYNDGAFHPEAVTTRAQYARMLVVTMGWSLIKPQEPRFTDVPPTDASFRYVETAAARGILPGFLDGTFAPDRPVSRSEAIHGILLATGKSVSGGRKLFAYLPPGHWAAGCNPSEPRRGHPGYSEQGYYCGSAPTTRADTSQVIYSLFRSLQAVEQNSPRDDQER